MRFMKNLKWIKFNAYYTITTNSTKTEEIALNRTEMLIYVKKKNTHRVQYFKILLLQNAYTYSLCFAIFISILDNDFSKKKNVI